MANSPIDREIGLAQLIPLRNRAALEEGEIRVVNMQTSNLVGKVARPLGPSFPRSYELGRSHHFLAMPGSFFPDPERGGLGPLTYSEGDQIHGTRSQIKKSRIH